MTGCSFTENVPRVKPLACVPSRDGGVHGPQCSVTCVYVSAIDTGEKNTGVFCLIPVSYMVVAGCVGVRQRPACKQRSVAV